MVVLNTEGFFILFPSFLWHVFALYILKFSICQDVWMIRIITVYRTLSWFQYYNYFTSAIYTVWFWAANIDGNIKRQSFLFLHRN